jgi:hypothetical protein
VKPTKLELMQFFIQCVRVDAARIGPAEVRMRYGVDPERCRMSLRGAAIRPSSCPVRPILHVRTGISGGGTLFGARERVAAVPFDCKAPVRALRDQHPTGRMPPRLRKSGGSKNLRSGLTLNSQP